MEKWGEKSLNSHKKGLIMEYSCNKILFSYKLKNNFLCVVISKDWQGHYVWVNTFEHI